MEIVEPEAVIDFFFGYALACTGHVPRNAKQALELVSAAELDGGLLTLLLLLSPCWRWRCRAKATCIPMLVRLQASEGHSERGRKKGRGSCIAISSLPALLAAPLVPPEGVHTSKATNERRRASASLTPRQSIAKPAFFGAPLLRRELSFGLAGIDLPLHLIFTPSSPCLRRRPLPSSRTLSLRNTSTPPSRRLDCNPHFANNLHLRRQGLPHP